MIQRVALVEVSSWWRLVGDSQLGKAGSKYPRDITRHQPAQFSSLDLRIHVASSCVDLVTLLIKLAFSFSENSLFCAFFPPRVRWMATLRFDNDVQSIWHGR